MDSTHNGWHFSQVHSVLLLKNMLFGSFNVFPNFDFDDQSSLLIHKYLF